MSNCNIPKTHDSTKYLQNKPPPSKARGKYTNISKLSRIEYPAYSTKQLPTLLSLSSNCLIRNIWPADKHKTWTLFFNIFGENLHYGMFVIFLNIFFKKLIPSGHWILPVAKGLLTVSRHETERMYWLFVRPLYP